LAHLRELLPEQTTRRSEEELLRLVDRGVDRAAEHGIDQQQQVALYVGLLLLLGEDELYSEETLAWIPATLDDADLPQEVRLEMIYQRLQEEEDAG